MPEKPTWDFVIDAANKLTDKAGGVYGICLRGKAGWGENMAFLTAMSNSFGARWFDEKWQPQFDKPEWKKTLTTYVDLMKSAGPPGASSNGFNENLALFNSGKCAMWIDATVAASFVTNPKDSQVADKVGFALAPNAGLGKNANWLWAWNLAIPAGSKKTAAAEKFIAWATSKDYTKLVASKEGWSNVPPGTRTSLYQNPEYLKVAPFAKLTLASIDAADPNKPTVQPVPYVGVQYAAIPEFQGIGTTVGQQFSAALAGSSTVDAALAAAQTATEREMKRAGSETGAPLRLHVHNEFSRHVTGFEQAMAFGNFIETEHAAHMRFEFAVGVRNCGAHREAVSHRIHGGCDRSQLRLEHLARQRQNPHFDCLSDLDQGRIDFAHVGHQPDGGQVSNGIDRTRVTRLQVLPRTDLAVADHTVNGGRDEGDGTWRLRLLQRRDLAISLAKDPQAVAHRFQRGLRGCQVCLRLLPVLLGSALAVESGVLALFGQPHELQL